MRISDWSSDVCSSDLPAISNLETLSRISEMLHSRRLRSTLFAGMVAALGATTSLAPARAQPASAPGDQGPPNILFVLVDDMGYGDLSIMGNTKIERSEESRVGKEWVRTCISRLCPNH